MPPKKTSNSSRASTRPTRSGSAAKEASTTSTPVSATKKRGRPPKTTVDEAEPPKKRGRPSKSDAKANASVKKTTTLPQQGRGRPRKDLAPVRVTTAEIEAAIAQSEVQNDAPPPPPSRGRGRPPKNKPAVSTIEVAPPKKRGRPPKGGQTTRASVDDIAAADQLQEELEDAVEKQEVDTQGELVSPKDEHASAAPVEETRGGAPAAGSGGNYFLMKAEQEDRFETLKSGRNFNTKFTIDDLRDKTEPEMWDGVRNAVARNVMKEMKTGDLAFFYASGGKKGRTPGITGIVEIVQEAQSDPTTHDEDAIGFVEKKTDRDKWVIVHVEYRKKLKNPVSLKTLQAHSGDGGKLRNMQVLNTARLSVSRVSAEEWNFIVDELIDGYEEN